MPFHCMRREDNLGSVTNPTARVGSDTSGPVARPWGIASVLGTLSVESPLREAGSPPLCRGERYGGVHSQPPGLGA
jgi:hypothetical protein